MPEEQHHTTQELFVLLEEYHITHPEQDAREGMVGAASPADTYYLGAVDFLQWLANGKQFLYQSDSLLDLTDEEFDAMFLDLEEEENCQRDETY